jgi:rRNA maturation endonuclease Nob1
MNHTELPWKGCCEHCGTRLKKSEKNHRFCERCGDEVADTYDEAEEAQR